MEAASGILIYAELLANIRRVSVGVSLPSSPNPSTKSEVFDHGRRLRVSHDGQQEDLELPARIEVNGPVAALPLPIQDSPEFSWRLPVALAEAIPTYAPPENQAIPWTAVDIIAESPISCRNCSQVIVSNGVIRVWKDLPSENWAEMMEFWHCHKPHDHNRQDSDTLASKGYGANNAIVAQPGVGFVDLTSFLFSESDCASLVYSTTTCNAGSDTSNRALDDKSEHQKFLHIYCRGCSVEVGLFNVLAASVTLFKWQVLCQTTSPSAPPSSSECLSATLVATISRSGSSKSIIAPHQIVSPSSATWSSRDDSSEMLHLWVLNPSVTYSSSAAPGCKTALKVLYRQIDTEEGNKMIESLNSDVQDIALPMGAIEAAEEELRYSNSVLPFKERAFKEWSVGLLARWVSNSVS